MRYRIRYFPDVSEEVLHFPPEVKRMVRLALDEVLVNPNSGSPLGGEFEGYWKYRAKRYRIIYNIRAEEKEIVIVFIDERASVYDRLRKMLAG